MSLEFRAAWWLKWEKRCPLVIMERSPREFFCGKPDVLGITDARFMLEVEVKRSLSDFKANAQKHHNQQLNSNDEEIRNKFAANSPKQFWFMVPRNLVDKVLPFLPAHAGLLTEDEKHYAINVIKPSPVNRLSTRLSLKECVMLVRLTGNQIISMQEGAQKRTELFLQNHDDEEFYGKNYDYNARAYVWRPDYSNYQI